MNNNRINTANRTTFTSYNKLNPETNLSVSTSFYNDYETLQKSVELIEKNFPKGTDILVYAGSNGEEAISLYSMFSNPKRYNIYSIDIFKEAIEYAKRGIYAVNWMDQDSFLTEENPTNDLLQRLKERFHQNLDSIEKPTKPLNNMQDAIYQITLDGVDNQKYFRLKPEVRRRINFLEGDIRDISSFKTKNDVGAIFFRNALYHLTKNDLSGVLHYGDKPDTSINKKQVLRELFDNIYKKLAPNGIFVMGNHTQEHFYIADEFTPLEKSVLYDKTRGIRIMNEPPHWSALLEHGGFVDEFSRYITGIAEKGVNIPLIWKKVK